jgi:aldehyde dehydrogenase (NAD+)
LYSTNHVQGYIQTGIDEGARLVAGGLGLPEGLTTGYFVRPTVFADVKSGMTIEKEEIFGPVLCIMPFDDEADALRIANETPYGLTNYVRQSICVCVCVCVCVCLCAPHKSAAPSTKQKVFC